MRIHRKLAASATLLALAGVAVAQAPAPRPAYMLPTQVAARDGAGVYREVCAACHMPDGSGMAAMGAPNLTDKVWLYGGSEASIIESIAKGRNGVMPGSAQTLGTTSNRDAKLHLLTAYIYGLSQQK